MNKLNLIQNTKEWEELRKTKLGASDANIIMGVSEYTTPLQLWNEKKGITKREEGNDFAKNKGHRLEEKYRNIYELETMLDWPPLVALHKDYNFFMASLDGYNEEINANWECKYVGQKDFITVSSGKMLDKYKPQVQFQLFMTGATCCHFLCATDDKESEFKFKKTVLIVELDAPYAMDVVKKMIRFKESLINDTPPEASDDDLIDLSVNKALDDLLNKYKSLLDQQDAISEQLDVVKKEVFKIATAPRNICNGVKITTTKSNPVPAPDYKEYCLDKKIEIPKTFWKSVKSSMTQKITFKKEDNAST